MLNDFVNSRLVMGLRGWFHPKDRSIIIADNCFLEFDILTSKPPNPTAGRIRLYARANELYMLESNGTETQVS